MALTDEQLERIRDEVGDQPDDNALEEIYARPDVEDEWDVITVVLKRRMAALASRPAKLNIPGEYGHDTGDNIKALTDQMARLGISGASIPAVPTQVRIVIPDDPRPLR